MIEALKPYVNYESSSVSWLKKYPAHWRLLRLGSLLKERAETNELRQIDQVLSVLKDVGVILYREEGHVGNKKSDDVSRYKIVRPNDMVINCMNVIIGSVGRSQYTGCLSPVYYVLTRRAETDHPRYLEAVFQVKPFQRSLVCIGNGILAHRMRIPMERLKAELLPLPPPDEQAAIVRFLDHANRRIDKSIRAKHKLISLLNEQKQSIIQRAVTQGLDADARFVDSRVGWLGGVPAHWSVRRIKYVLREVDHRSTSGKETLLSLRMHHGIVPFHKHFSRPPQAATLVGFKLVRPGQFVINRMQAGNGVIFPSGLHGLVSPDYAVFDAIGDVNVEFLGELFRCRKLRGKFRAESKGLGTGTSGFLRLYTDRLGAIHIALPPRSEQDSILRDLTGQLEELNAALGRTDREIALMREYRMRLVVDVVTGQLDVRDAVRTLPVDEPDAALPDDLERDVREDEGDFEESEVA